MPSRKAIKRTTRVARPYIIAYQKSNRWFIAALPNEREALEKAHRLIDRGRSLVLLCRCYAELRPEEIPNNDKPDISLS